MDKKKTPSTMALTPEQFQQKVFDLYDTWQDDSNQGTQTQSELSTIAEQFRDDLKDAIVDAGGHPKNPPPRIRP